MRRLVSLTAISLAALVGVAAFAAAAGTTTKRDKVRETKQLRDKPELDIARTKTGETPDGRVKHAITMVGNLTPNKLYSRPFILINEGTSRGGRAEYLVIGPRIFKIPKEEGKDFKKVGAATIKSHKRTWTYKFDPAKVGSAKSTYGWQIRTLKGKTEDRFPPRRWALHRR